MVSKTFCDRCRKEETKGHEFVSMEIYIGEILSLDLCSECYKSFTLWLKNK